MRPALSRAAQALLPIAVWVVLPLLKSHLASPQDSAAHQEGDWTLPQALSPERFFANNSLLNRSVPCTDQEKECLRYNRIYYARQDRCYALGDGPERCHFAVDRWEFERKSGHIRGHCVPTDLCPPYNTEQVKMAYDGQCVTMGKLSTVCGEGPVNIALHFFGDAECVRSQGITPPQPKYIQQPKRKGLCYFPNLRYDLTSVVNQEFRVMFKMCSYNQSRCFGMEQVWLKEHQMCYRLLKRGPCDEGSWVVLNRTEWKSGNVEATCKPKFPCHNNSDQHRLMAFDEQCYDASTIRRVLCPGGVLLPNAFGEMSCVTRDYYKHVIELRSARMETCELTHKVSYDDEPAGMLVEPECGITDSGSCIDAF